MATKKEKKFNGKPMSHWRRLAHELVIEQLVRASLLDTRSIIGQIASERLMNLANGIDPEEVRSVLKDRQRFQRGASRALASMGLGFGRRNSR